MLQSLRLRIANLGEIFGQWPYKVHWLVTNGKMVLNSSPEAEHKLGLTSGEPGINNPLIHKALRCNRIVVDSFQTWRQDQLVSMMAAAVPLEAEHAQHNEERYVLIFGAENCPALDNIQEATALILDTNRQTSTLAALQVLTQGCLKLFGCQAAAVWALRSEKYYLLAQSADNSPNEQILKNNLGRPGLKNILSYPLHHLGQELGVLELMSYGFALDEGAALWLNLLAPLAASLVHEHEMQLAAAEREKDLNLLLWGTEILVQVQSEQELLEEAGEMAMVLNLEAGFFFMRQEEGWKIAAPFGRLKQNESGWEQWLIKQIRLDPNNYPGHENSHVMILKPSWDEPEDNFPWRKLIIQPVETNSGIIGEFWLLDHLDSKLENRREIFAAFARSLGVALETIRQRKILEQMATTDPLTGILNRQGFDLRFRAEMAAALRRGTSCLFLLLDLDGFKRLNDTHGHPTGDKALSVIARNISASVRKNDIVARSGGDEFLIVLTDMHKGPDAVLLINKLKEKMGLEEFELGVSIGVAEYPTEADTYEQLYHLADERLYLGKHSGKNQVRFE